MRVCAVGTQSGCVTFQDAYESVCSGHTEWVCECLSGHTASFRMPMRMCAVGTQSGYATFQDAYESVCSGHTEWVCECLSGQVPRRGSEWCHESGHTVGVRILEWARSTARKRVVPRRCCPRFAVVQQWCSSSAQVVAA